MKIRRILAALLALLLLLLSAATAEEDFDFDFDDEGYTGEWMEIAGLGIELCLPDGWTPVDADEGAAFAAATEDGAAHFAIRVTDDSVQDIVTWGDEHLDGYDIDDSGFFDTLVVEEAQLVSIYRLDDNGNVLAYEFSRRDADSISRAFALEIVDSVSEAWTEDELSEEDNSDVLSDAAALDG